MVGRRVSGFMALVALGLLIAVGCASSPAASPSASISPKPSGQASAPASAQATPAPQTPKTAAEALVYRGSDRQKILEDGARKEGKMTWYTSDVGDIIKALTDGFKAKYPFMQPEVFRADTNDLGTKVMQEAQAGQQTFDVLSTQPQVIRVVGDAGLLAPFYLPALTGVPDNLKTPAPNGNVLGVGIRVSYVGFGYNTTLFPESALPKKFEDLMSPPLMGKLAMAGSSTGQRWLGLVMQSMGEEKGRKFLEEFASKQKPSVQQISGGALLDLVAKGEVPGSPNIFREHVDQAASKGGPVKWVAMELSTANINEATIAAKAPHPYAALLFLDFAMSAEGRAIFQKNFMATGAETENFKTWVPEQGKTTAQIERDVKAWSDMFKNLFMR